MTRSVPVALKRQRGDVYAEVLEVVRLGTKGQRTHTRVRPVGANDEIEPARGPRQKFGRDPVRVRRERRDGVAELKLRIVRHRFAQDCRELAPRQLNVAGVGPSGPHVDPTHHLSACVDEDHVAHACVGGADPRHQTHPLGDLDGGSPDVDRAATGSHLQRLFNDRHLETSLGKPICGRRAGNARARDQRLAHETEPNCIERKSAMSAENAPARG
jgi:hypothetical protein